MRLKQGFIDLLSYGKVEDSSVEPWLGPLQAGRPPHGREVALHGP